MIGCDDECLVSVFEFLGVVDLISCESVCRRWGAMIQDRNNGVVNSIWGRLYSLLLENPSIYPLCNLMIDWRGKCADVFPITLTKAVARKLVIEDVFLDKLRLSCRAGHSATFIGEVMLLFGGASHLFMFTNTVDIVSFASNKILAVNKQPIDAPSPRWLHTVSAIGDKTVLFGGQSDSGLENDSYLIHKLTYSENGVPSVRFERLQNMGLFPSPRGGHSMALDHLHARLIFFGGMTDGQVCLNDTRSLQIVTSSGGRDFAHWSSVPHLGQAPSPRWCHSCCVVREAMLVFGGWRYASAVGSRHTFLNDLHMFHLSSATWVQVRTSGVPPRPRCQAPCWTVPSAHCRPTVDAARQSNTFLVVYGGACHAELETTNAVVDLDDLRVLDLDTMAWLPFSAPFPRCRGGINAVVLTPKGWLLSGGMHSETVAHTPRFINDLVYIRPNLGGCNNLSPSQKLRDEFRIASKFILYVDAK